MRGVTNAQLRAAIYSKRGKLIDACIRSGDRAFEYTYENFLTDLIQTGTLCDERTIRTKWSYLQMDGTIVTDGRHTFLSVMAFARLSHEARGGESEREINAQAYIAVQGGAQ